jgi:hypothetical protein
MLFKRNINKPDLANIIDGFEATNENEYLRGTG